MKVAFIPFEMRKVSSSGKNNSLPAPPTIPGYNSSEAKPEKYVEIRGFLGNKVIVEINGFTDSLAVGETLEE